MFKFKKSYLQILLVAVVCFGFFGTVKKQAKAEELSSVAMAQTQSYLFVANKDSGKLYIFDKVEGIPLVKTITIGSGPSHMIVYHNYENNNDYLLVALSQAKKIKVIKISTLEVLGDVNTPKMPYWLAQDKINSIFVTVSKNNGASYEPFVISINGDDVVSASSTQPIWPATSYFVGNEHIIIDSLNVKAFIGNTGYSPDNISKFDIYKYDDIKFLLKNSHGSLGSNGKQFIFNEDKTKIYFAASGSAGYNLQVVNPVNLTKEADLSLGAYPNAVGLDENYIYAGRAAFNSDAIKVYDKNNIFVRSYSFGSGETLVDRGISATNTGLFVSTNKYLYKINQFSFLKFAIYDFVNEKEARELEISNIELQYSSTHQPTEAFIVWETNLDANSYVYYVEKGKDNWSGEGLDNVSKVHAIKLSNLRIPATYQYYVSSKDVNGNIAKSTTRELTTGGVATPSTKPDLVITDVQIKTATPIEIEGKKKTAVSFIVIYKNIGNTDISTPFYVSMESPTTADYPAGFKGGRYVDVANSPIKTNTEYTTAVGDYLLTYGTSLLDANFTFYIDRFIPFGDVNDNIIKESNENNNTFTKTINLRSTDSGACSDSDGGQNYFSKGEASKTVNGYTTGAFDTCLDTNTLYEAYCSNVNVMNETYKCSNGCKDGACVGATARPDLMIESITLSPENPFEYEHVTITVKGKNIGTASVSSCDFGGNINNQLGLEATAVTPCVNKSNPTIIKQGDSFSFIYKGHHRQSGNMKIYFDLTIADDLNKDNNSLVKDITVHPRTSWSGISNQGVESGFAVVEWATPIDIVSYKVAWQEEGKLHIGQLVRSDLSSPANKHSAIIGEGGAVGALIDGKTYEYTICNKAENAEGEDRDYVCAWPVKFVYRDGTGTTIICATEYSPVCGADNKIYSNECNAKKAGVNVAYKGECKESPPVIISNLQVPTSLIRPTTAIVSWTTNYQSNSNVHYWSADKTQENWNWDKIDDYTQTNHVIKLKDLKPFTTYYFTVSSTKEGGNNSTSEQMSFTTTTLGSVVDNKIDAINNVAKNLNENKFDQILAEIKTLKDIIKEQEAQIKYLSKLTQGVQKLSEKVENAINNFITYGVDDNTKRLGAGERAAVMYSYKAAFDKLPETDEELADAIKIANGRWPSITNLNAENKAKEHFKKIYKRAPDMNNGRDNAAVTIMTYGLRQRAENRNMESERAGIAIFKGIYKKLPETTEDWNIMQAITYSGAAR